MSTHKDDYSPNRSKKGLPRKIIITFQELGGANLEVEGILIK